MSLTTVPKSAFKRSGSTSLSSAERYLPQFKRKVLQFLVADDDKHGGQSASCSNAISTEHGEHSLPTKKRKRNTRVTIVESAKTFGVHPTTISDWIHEEQRQSDLHQLEILSSSVKGVEESNKSGFKPTSTSSVHCDCDESRLIEWLQQRRIRIPDNTSLPSTTPSTKVILTKAELVNHVRKCKQGTSIPVPVNPKCATGEVKISNSTSSSNWFSLWCQKVLSSESEGIKSDAKRIQYSTPFKLEMVEYSKLFGQRKTARLFCISQRRIFDWISNFKTEADNGKLEAVVKKTRTSSLKSTSTPCNSSKSLKSAEHSKRGLTQVIDVKIEQDIFNWVVQSSSSKQLMKPTSTQIRDKGRELYRQNGYTQIQCSYGWYRRWCKRFDLSTCPHNSTDDEILSWLLQQYDDNNLVTYKQLQAYTQQMMTKISSEKSVDDSHSQCNNPFKASHGWATRFFKRNHLIINWCGHYSKTLPKMLESAAQDFLKGLKSSILSRLVIAMDEIPLSFASTYVQRLASDSGTLQTTADLCNDVKRLRRVTIKNCEATLVLCLLGDGTVLPPMIIVKGQESGNWNQVYTKTDNPVVVYYSESTEPTVKSLEKWLDLILVKGLDLAGSLAKSPLLLWDSYSLHAQMDKKCKKLGIKTQVFPSGCSCKLQPINVVGRRLLLKHIDYEWSNYLTTSHAEQSTKISIPSTDDIVDWVYKAFRSLQQQKDALRDSFRILDKIEGAELNDTN